MKDKYIGVRKRVYIILGILLCMSLVVSARIGWMQLVKGDDYIKKANQQHLSSKNILGPRGVIYDRMGRELAISVVTYSLWADPYMLKDKKELIAKEIALIIDKKEQDILELISDDSRFCWIKRGLDKEKMEAIKKVAKELKVDGLGFEEEAQRYYPNDTLAAHILGYVGTDGHGLDGIEYTFEKILRGSVVKRVIQHDLLGKPVFESVKNYAQGIEGQNVYLTIDSHIQHIVERRLDQAMKETKAKGAVAIIMNPQTGEILAMASRPNFNPNTFYRYNENTRRNRAVSIIYEPGSTFKSIITASAFQEGLVSPEQRFNDKGYVEVSGRKIKNWSNESYGNISFMEVVKSSINTGFVEVGLKLGSTKLNDYAKNFGLGKRTGIEVPGEEQGLLFTPSEMRDVDIASMSIGQGIAVTPIQLVTAIGAIANDGMLLKPYIIKEIKNAQGEVVTATPTTPIKQVITPNVAKEVKVVLEQVISSGGGKQAYIEGFRFAGKTGTAEKLKESGIGYEQGSYISSIVGFGPVSKPQFAVLILIDDPEGAYYGGQVAAPIFKDIMTQVLRYMNVLPEEAMNIPEIINKSSNKSNYITEPKDKPVMKIDGKTVVPNINGLTIRQASQKLSEYNLNLIPVGTGVAINQDIPAGTIIKPGTEITVYFEQRK